MSGVTAATSSQPTHSHPNQARPEKEKTVFETARDVGLGTVNGVFLRYLGMPIESVFVKRSFHDCTKSYPQLFRDHVFNLKELRRLQTEIFTRTCLHQSAYKSLSNSGVSTLVEMRYPHLSPLQKGVLVGALSTCLETITTTPGEWNKTILLDDKNTKNIPIFNAFRLQNLRDPKYHRCLRATFIRAAWSSFFTYGGIYGLEACVTPLYPGDEYKPRVKVFSAFFGAVIPQFIIMPGVNLQTYVFRNPDLPWRLSIKQCLADYGVTKVTHVYKLMRGCEVRAVHRGATYALNFLFIEIMKAMQQPRRPTNYL